MPQIPFPQTSADGKFAESGGRLINAYAERLDDGRTRRGRVPGIRQIAEIAGYSHCRGSIEVNGVFLAALDDRLVKIEQVGTSYTITDLGAFAGEEAVFFARNNKAPTPDIVAVTNSTAFVVSLTTGASGYPDGDVGSPNSVAFLGGYFVFSYGNARMRTSGLNDTSINTLDTAFAESRPDGLLRVLTTGKNLLACGPTTIEVWVNTGNPNGFPFSYVETIPRGIAASTAIAGSENDWSSDVIFVSGDNTVCRMSGYSPQVISGQPVQRDLETLADKSTLNASVYVHEGHSIWVLSCAEWTWCYDASTRSWFERKSYNSTRWRASSSVKCFGSWVVGDTGTGKFGVIDQDYAYDFDTPISARIVSATMTNFPRQSAVSQLDLDILAGTGRDAGAAPIETDPVCKISWSMDGGASFGSPVSRAFGPQGGYARTVRVNRLGLVRQKGMQVAVEVTDPVRFSLFDGNIETVSLK